VPQQQQRIDTDLYISASLLFGSIGVVLVYSFTKLGKAVSKLGGSLGGSLF